MAVYSPGQVPYTEDVQQLERYLSNEHESIRNSTDDIYTLADIIKRLYVIAGYGGIGLDAVTSLATINATKQTLPFDVELIAQPQGIEYSLGSNGMIFNTVGIWRINAKVSLEFVEQNAGRRMQLQLFNLNQGIDAGPVFNFGIGRNTDAVNLAFNLIAEIPESQVGDTFLLRVFSTTDTFTTVQAIGSIWDTNHVSEYKGDSLLTDARAILGVG